MSRADLAMAIRRASQGQIKATERGIRGWEKNEYVPHGESVPAIATALSCQISDLFETNGDGRSVDDSEPELLPSLDEALRSYLRILIRDEVQAATA